jgi:NADP-dependent 3-hydroxy acid dehydrogenase YdfG
MALELAHAGVSIVLVGRDSAKLCAVAAEAKTRGTSASLVPLALDLTSPDADQALVHVLASRFGRLDILVHSAGVFEHGAIADVDAATVRDMIDCNAIGPYAVTRGVLPMLVAGGGQVVVMNSSVVGARRGGIAAYAASKAALAAFTDTLREELNPCGVRVLGVFIGRTATPMQERIFEAEGRAYDPGALLQPEDVASVVMTALALPPTAEVTDLHIRPMRKPSASPAAASHPHVLRAE